VTPASTVRKDTGRLASRRGRLCVTCVAAAVTFLLTLAPASAQQADPLARARTLYNQRQFDAAITAADDGRAVPERADSADLIAARSYLERFRESGEPADLTNARERLRRIDATRLQAGERTELVVGLAETLYFDGAAGAAAAVFDSVLVRRETLDAESRERVLDWWASAVDSEARPRPDIERQVMYQRIRDRMREELGANPASATASYWLPAAARGQGDLQAAWEAAEAGWVRAPLANDRGAALRGDLDRLMQVAIAPERARALAEPADMVLAEWEQFKEKWSAPAPTRP